MNKLFISLALALSIGQSVSAQFAIPATSHTQQAKARGELRSSLRSDTLRITPPAASSLASLRSSNRSQELRTLRFAESLTLDISPSTHGKWQTESDGSRTWLLTLQSAGARSLGLSFDAYHLPKGAKLFLHASNGLMRGAYTEQNNTKAGRLDMAHLRGDAVTIELNLPSNVSPNEARLHLGTLHYGYIDPYLSAESMRASDKSNALGEPFYNIRGTGLERLSCAPNVVGFPEYKAQSRATVLMAIEGNTMGTGTLINNSNNDGTAYVLTASHNVNRLFNEDIDTWQEVEDICKTIVFFFGFESPSVDQDMRGTEELTLSGAQLIAYNPDADMALLKISGLPTDTNGSPYIPDYYNVYYSGWNISDSPEAPYYGIHHALASTKRVCIAADESLSIIDYSLSFLSFTQKHWRVQEWTTGITEAGSSGSALFDKNGLIIGGLSGGSSTCGSPFKDTYFAIKQTWQTGNAQTSLMPWLDPNNSGVKQLAGYDPHSASTKQISRVSPYYAKPTSTLSWSSYTTSNGVTGIGRNIKLSGSVVPLGVYLQLGVGSVLLNSANVHVVELYPITNGKVEATPVWSSTLDNYNYTGYNKSTQQFVSTTRTVGEDEIELFIPSTTTTQLTTGEYLLSIRPSNGTDLSLPILSEFDKRLTSPTRGYSVWTRASSGVWAMAPSSHQSVWLDLLVQGTKQANEEVRQVENDPAYPSYYYGETLYTFNAGGKAELRVYGLDGMLWLKQELSEGESQTNIAMIPSRYTYVVQIKGDRGTHSYKFAKK